MKELYEMTVGEILEHPGIRIAMFMLLLLAVAAGLKWLNSPPVPVDSDLRGIRVQLTRIADHLEQQQKEKKMLSPEVREEIRDFSAKFWSDPTNAVAMRYHGQPELAEICAETITAIQNKIFDAKIARKLRNALDNVDCPVGQYGRLGQPVTTKEESDARCRAVGLPVLEFAIRR
jgi:hypothetical protein